jgi:hypothetical protein
LPETPALVNAAVAPFVENAAPVALDAVTDYLNIPPSRTTLNHFEIDLWTLKKFRVDLAIGNIDIHRAITPKDLIRLGSLGLGVLYYGASVCLLQLLARASRRKGQRRKKGAIKRKRLWVSRTTRPAARKQ